MKEKILTKWSVKEIEELIISNSSFFNIRNDIAIPNLSWSLLPYEADLIILNKSGYISEFEIKRSYEDLKHDFNKKTYHDSELIYKFYYVLPLCLEEKAQELFDKHTQDENYIKLFGKTTENIKHYPAVLYYDEDGKIKTNKQSPYLWGKHRKLFLEEKVTLMRLLSIRYWNLRMKNGSN